MKRVGPLLLLPLLMLLAGVRHASAAAPSCILVVGPGLAKPILLDDWFENYELLISTDLDTQAIPESASRPRFQLAAFWGRENLDPRCPGDLKPESANATGTFFPAFRGSPAVIEWDSSVAIGGATRRLGAPNGKAVAALQQHGIPTNVSDATPGPPSAGTSLAGRHRDWPPSPAALAAVALLFCVATTSGTWYVASGVRNRD